eukprot:6184375-Pleurochrysis_carterae.AAC.1
MGQGSCNSNSHFVSAELICRFVQICGHLYIGMSRRVCAAAMTNSASVAIEERIRLVTIDQRTTVW